MHQQLDRALQLRERSLLEAYRVALPYGEQLAEREAANASGNYGRGRSQ